MEIRRLCAAGIGAIAITSGPSAHAHHGVAGLGAAGLEGPGAPLEAATSATLPEKKLLTYLKLDHARYETKDPDPSNPESDYANFWIAGLGFGFKSWLSAYVFLPYNDKVDEPGGFDADGFADVSVFGQMGFKYDEGFKLIPVSESIDDLSDWHMTVFGGLTLPTGDANLRDSDGNIDPGKSTSFGEPSYNFGLTATKMLSERWTYNLELSGIWFEKHRYDDGNEFQFGNETRFNNALIYRAYTDMDSKLRIDLALEAQYLGLERDKGNGVPERATGGDMLYLVPGVRLLWRQASAALGIKAPVWTDLNEEDEQQGGEGTEDYRIIFTISALF
ncbi:MAG: transporter [Gammaproteobacteria bacterium]|nr:transporter [Gammaproteobacteria bacterium]